jgi:hypothetical protein
LRRWPTRSPLLLPRYYVALEERVYVSAWPDPMPAGIPDLAIVPRGRQDSGTRIQEASAGRSYGGSGVQVLTAAVPVPEYVHETYLEVREPPGGEVITVVEILSPSNKRPGEGRRAFEEKRMRMLGSATHLVEIDLLRAGIPPPFFVPGQSPDAAWADALLREAGQR